MFIQNSFCALYSRKHMNNQVCFDQGLIYTSLFVFLFSIVIFYYTFKKSNERFSSIDLYSSLTKDSLREKLKEIETKLYKAELDKQECERQLSTAQANTATNTVSINRIYNPLIAPERTYPNLSNTDQSYQQVGYITNTSSNTLRFPLFGRKKYRRSDKWEYYIIDNSENKIKIPIQVRNENELFNGDSVVVDSDTYQVAIYEIDNIRYNPDLY